MNKKNIPIAAMAALLVLGMTAMAFAGPGQGRGNGQGNGPCNGYYSQLTPEKQQAVEAIYDKYEGKFDTLRTQMWTKHSTLQAMVNGGNADEKKISQLTASISKLRDEMRETGQAMRAELEKETGLVASRGNGRGCAGSKGRVGMGPGQGRGQGMGYGQGGCTGAGPVWN